jgi:hypothetical protein
MGVGIWKRLGDGERNVEYTTQGYFPDQDDSGLAVDRMSASAMQNSLRSDFSAANSSNRFAEPLMN